MTSTAIAADLVAFSAQIACVIAVAGLLSLAVRIDRAGFRYQYWRGVLLFCVLLPWLQGRQFGAGYLVETTAGAALPPGANLWVWSVDVVAPADGAVWWLQAALWIVLVGIVIRLAYVALGLVRLGRLRHSGRAASAAEHDDLQRALGTRAEIRYVGEGQPVTWGVWRPVVVLPEGLTSQPPEIQRAVSLMSCCTSGDATGCGSLERNCCGRRCGFILACGGLSPVSDSRARKRSTSSRCASPASGVHTSRRCSRLRMPRRLPRAPRSAAAPLCFAE